MKESSERAARRFSVAPMMDLGGPRGTSPGQVDGLIARLKSHHCGAAIVQMGLAA